MAIAAIQLAVPTIEALVSAAGVVQKSWALFQKGDISKDELLKAWQDAGVSVRLADANLQAAMDEALKKG